jgi:hypothetical protein
MHTHSALRGISARWQLQAGKGGYRDRLRPWMGEAEPRMDAGFGVSRQPPLPACSKEGTAITHSAAMTSSGISTLV